MCYLVRVDIEAVRLQRLAQLSHLESAVAVPVKALERASDGMRYAILCLRVAFRQPVGSDLMDARRRLKLVR